MTYNILAQKYAQSGWHSYCPSQHLRWESRRERLFEEIDSYGTDIICLQEVESGVFSEELQPWLAERGYQGHYLARQYGENVQSPPEGVALFYRTDVFELLHHRAFTFSSTPTDPPAPLTPSLSSTDGEDAVLAAAAANSSTASASSSYQSVDFDANASASDAGCSSTEGQEEGEEGRMATSSVDLASPAPVMAATASSAGSRHGGGCSSSSSTSSLNASSTEEAAARINRSSSSNNSSSSSSTRKKSRGKAAAVVTASATVTAAAAAAVVHASASAVAEPTWRADSQGRDDGPSTSGRGGGGGRSGGGRGTNEFWNVFTRRQEGAILALLRHRPTQREVLAAVTHLYWNPAFPDVKVFQAAALCREMSAFLREHCGGGGEADKVAVVLAGDFNSLSRKRVPDVFDQKVPRGTNGLVSGVYTLLTRGSLPPDHPDHPAARRRPGEAGNWDFQQLELDTGGLRLASAYSLAHGRDPPLTTRTATFAGCLDYIFVSPQHLEVTRTLELPYDYPRLSYESMRDPLSDVDFPPIPNDVYPSDHLSLAALLRLKG